MVGLGLVFSHFWVLISSWSLYTCSGSEMVGSDLGLSLESSGLDSFSGLCLVSDLQQIMAESRDYNELLFAWQGWRNASGRELRQDYKRYVQLANKAATLNGKVFKITDPKTFLQRLAVGRFSN